MIQIASDEDDVGVSASAPSPTTTAAGDKAARTRRTSTTAADWGGTPAPEKSELLSPARRRGFTSPSSLDQDD